MDYSLLNNAIPSFASKVIDVLEQAGFEAWIVGGFVRDALMGCSGNDVDIATSATWQETQCVCEQAGMQTHETGTVHGTLTVVVNNHAIEVTTYRADGTYSDARHPDSISWVRSIEEDLARRDFTINALAYHPRRGLKDPYDGFSDIKQGIIRAVGDPLKRFSEDALRIMRGCRLASQLGFSIEEKTLAAMNKSKTLMLRVSTERIVKEFEELLLGDNVHDTLMQTTEILSAVMPELMAMRNFDQCTPYHIYDVLEHTAYVVQNVPANPLARWVALFHDIGKPAAFFKENGQGHFYGHAKISVVIAQGIMDRWKFPAAFQKRATVLIRMHDDLIQPNSRSVKRVLKRFEGDVDLFKTLCDIKYADALAQAPCCRPRIELANDLRCVLEKILTQNEAFIHKHLALNGNDIIALGVKRGPAVGKMLDAMLDAVIDEQVQNTSEALREFVLSRLESEFAR